MVFKELEIQGFKSFPDKVRIRFDEGVTGVVGPNGSGKSTFLRCLNRLEEPDEGSIIINGQDVRELSEKELNIARRNIGMIFQQFNLLSQASILDNVCFPMEIAHWKKADAKKRALELIELVGLHSRLSLSAVKFFLQLISIALLRLIYFHNLFRGEYFPELIIIFLAHIQYLTALCKTSFNLLFYLSIRQQRP